jgi:membrane fusion protein, multidrug efflux system
MPSERSDSSTRRARPPTWIGSHRILAVILLIAALLVIWLIVDWASKPKKTAGPPPSIPVASATVVVGSIDVYYDALGTVTPVYTVTVASRVAGEMTEVRYKEGQIVKKNELLAVIDPRPYQAALLQSQGQLARDEAALKNARIDLVRYDNSFREHAIPQQQLATQQAAVDHGAGAGAAVASGIVSDRQRRSFRDAVQVSRVGTIAFQLRQYRDGQHHA